MRFFTTLVKTLMSKALFAKGAKRPSSSAQLTLEALEAREVPAVGKWYPVPTAPVSAPASLIAPSPLTDAVQVPGYGTLGK